MQLRSKIFLLLIVLMNCCNAINAQVKFTASITPATIGKDETAELKLMFENTTDVQQLSPPSLKNFTVLSGPNQESAVDIVGNSARQYIAVTYLLKPKSRGDFVIPPATAKVGGKIIRSNAVKLKVVNESTGNSANRNSPFSGLMQLDEPEPPASFNDYILKKGDNIQDKINKNIFIKVDAGKTSCYVGEPIVVTYKLYTRLKSESNIVKNPSFNGFSVIDLFTGPNINYVPEKFEGRDYNVYTLRKAQLYPLQAGAMELETAAVENDIHFIKEAYLKASQQTDFFGNRVRGAIPADAFVDEKITLQSKSLPVNVKPLPDAGKPATFNGAVGNFTIDAALEKDSLTTDDAGKLRVTISGEGNFTIMNAPEFLWPAGIDGFEPAVKDELNKTAVPVSGSKIFEYSFSFTKAGRYQLPAVDYSFFDPASGSYKTISTKPFSITVAKGTGKKPVLPNDYNTTSGESISETMFTKRWLIIIPVALLILAGLFVWLRAETKKENKAAIALNKEKANNTDEETLPEHVNPLAQTENMLAEHDARKFYVALNKELNVFLAEKLQLAPEALNRKTIAEALDKTALNFQDSLAIQQLLDAVSMQLYTPFADEGLLHEHYEQAISAIHSFTKKTV